MGNSRSGHAALSSPCATVKEARDCSQKDITPVEVHAGTVVVAEVHEAEEHSSDKDCQRAAQAAFEQVLEPSAEEKLLRHGDEEEDADPGSYKLGSLKQGHLNGKAVDEKVRMKKVEGKAGNDRDRKAEDELAQSDARITRLHAKIEARPFNGPESNKCVNAEIEEKESVEDGEVRRPGGIEQAKNDNETKKEKDEELSPTHARGGHREQYRGDSGRQEDVKGQPWPTEDMGVARDKDVDCGK